MDVMDDDFEFPDILPEWAEEFHPSEGKHQIGAQLATKDGRVTGNGVIFCAVPWKFCPELYLFLVVTDAGNVLTLTEAELNSLFHWPQYIADLNKPTPAEVMYTVKTGLIGDLIQDFKEANGHA